MVCGPPSEFLGLSLGNLKPCRGKVRRGWRPSWSVDHRAVLSDWHGWERERTYSLLLQQNKENLLRELGQLHMSAPRGHKHPHSPQYPRSSNPAGRARQQESPGGGLLFRVKWMAVGVVRVGSSRTPGKPQGTEAQSNPLERKVTRPDHYREYPNPVS